MNSRKQIFIVGAGSVGGHVASNPELYGLEDFDFIFLDDDPKKIGQQFVGFPVLDRVNYLLKVTQPTKVIVGIAFPKIKEFIVTQLKENPNLCFPTLVAQKAWVSNGVTLGEGCIIYPHCSINYGAEVKNYVVMNMNCALGHHVKVGSYTSLAPGVNLGGHTQVGDRTELGIGAATKQFISIGSDCVVGGNAMVVSTVPNGLVVKGIPAK